MDDKTFVAALQRYEKVRDRNYQGASCSPVKQDLSKESNSRSEESKKVRENKLNGREEYYEKVLRQSPFFNKLNQKLNELVNEKDGDVSEEICKNALKEYEKLLAGFNADEIKEVLASIS
mmetsp:Transcript_1662/g.2016  ORF Transcript_1662/g.2016 Transcript_1662/m.2016 type:complete len:120 (+) Transcript_1662:169-528(+)|eukprot:CAMPEP_0184014682 /NCGR_PEP_ID=MMETSP0954-20121128/5838_1 /TAXON_ID=627963 /ORGANISM="Aplanochytrium sp, Strain PBS07" /LENGTH=119 /DNA_ID=CAMNT_0026295277 /DNA_START=2349 /DNA_END=2708 /DNA_ORIENTATION=-